MKQKRNLLIIILLSSSIGWALGFLRLPYMEKNNSFLLGFLSGLALILFVIMLLFIWNKNALLLQLIGKNSTSKDSSNPAKIYKLIRMLIAALIVIGGLVSSFFVFQQHKFSKNQIEQQKKNIAEQTQLLASTRKSNSLVLINNLFNLIDEELKNNPKRILSEETIARVEALNYAFEPDKYAKTDSLASHNWSPERGQLLLMLSTLNMDSSSFAKIKMKTTFRGADLRNANLSGSDLSGVDLRNANLKNADLSQTNLTKANLKEANLWGANLSNANMTEADMMKVELSWAEMNEAKMNGAKLKWGTLVATKLRSADLVGADLSWSDMSGVFLNKANMSRADLTEVNLAKANVSEVNLSNATMKYSNLSQANLTKTNLRGVEMTSATVYEKDWLEQLKKWEIIGLEEIQTKYKVIDDVFKKYNYRLKKL